MGLKFKPKFNVDNFESNKCKVQISRSYLHLSRVKDLTVILFKLIFASLKEETVCLPFIVKVKSTVIRQNTKIKVQSTLDLKPYNVSPSGEGRVDVRH